MSASGGSHFDKLKEAGIIKPDCDPFPEAYADFVDGLTPDEVDILIAIKRRLDAADKQHLGRALAPGEEPHFVVCVMF
jgi:hypothetical protein